MNIQKLSTESQIVKVFNEWLHPYIILDTETTSLNIRDANVISFTVASPDGNTVYFIPGSYIDLLRHVPVPFVCHNFKYDFGVLYHKGIDLRDQGLMHDTMLLDHLLNEENDHDLDSIVKRYFNDDYKQQFWAKYEDITEAPEADLIEYSGKDAGYTAKVYEKLMNEVQVPKNLLIYVREFALALYATELRGIRVDIPYLHGMGRELQVQLSQLLVDMRSQAEIECAMVELDMFERELEKRKTIKGKLGVKKPHFNFGSSTQLGTLIYDYMGLPEIKNDKGSRTVDDNALAKLESEHTLIPLIRKYRELDKIKTAFIDGTLEQLNRDRVHPSFNVNGTVTGRISSSKPNMQQLPREGGVRGIYIPSEGHIFVSYDYSQLEVTVAAHFSQDENLLRIINGGASQHDITANGLGIDRSTAKTINFALQYGAGAQKIQKILKCSITDAEQALNKYWETYAGLSRFIQSVHHKIEKGEPLVNPFGRIRHLPSKAEMDAKWGDQGFYSKKESKFIYFRDIYWSGVLRQGPNSLIQGTGADLTNYSYLLIDNKLKELGLGKALFPIHDEILVECKKDTLDQVKDIMQTVMVAVGKELGLTVDLKVDGGKPMDRWCK